jgi:pyruvate/2-oxoglutarate dehydrogenase complex dihydrolipoamide acyltransferase (E2) component
LTDPHRLKEYFGTVCLTAVGMFGTGGGWGIPVTNHTLQITLGGISEKPGVVDGKIEIREYLCVTVSIDHDIVDGAPAARFTQRLKELVESCYGLSDLD